MKNFFFIMLTVCMGLSYLSKAQTGSHLTIDSVNVQYRETLQDTAPAENLTNRFIVIPEILISLKNTDTISKIYFEMYQSTDSLIYQVQYDVNSSTVTNEQSIKMYERSGNSIFISPALTMPLELYTYKMQTEDSLQNRTTSFIITQ